MILITFDKKLVMLPINWGPEFLRQTDYLQEATT